MQIRLGPAPGRQIELICSLRQLRGSTEAAGTVHADSVAHSLLTGNLTHVESGSGNREQSARRSSTDSTLVSPLLEVRTLDVEQLGDTSFLVRLVLQNSGWLPTNVTQKAVERQAVRDLEVELELPDDARLVGGEVKTTAGQLRGRVEKRSTTWWGNDESTTDLAKLEWVIEAPAGTEIGIEARHPRAGTIRKRVTLT